MFRAHPINIVPANAHRRETEQARQADSRFSALDKTQIQFVTRQFHFLDSPRIVSAMPLNKYVSRVVGALAKGGRVFGAHVFRDFAHYAQMRFVAGILDKDSPPTRRHNNRLAYEANVTRAYEVIFPSHAIATKLHPVRTTPSIALELNDLLYEIPCPSDFSFGR